jgi:hypothetical protein
MQMTMRVKWMGASFARRVDRSRHRATDDAAKYLRDEIVRLITVAQGSYSPPNHSAPGDYPYWISRDLANSYFARTDRATLSAVIGSPLVYARYLEQGTSIMAPRPHIYRTLRSRRVPMAHIMCRPVA